MRYQISKDAYKRGAIKANNTKPPRYKAGDRIGEIKIEGYRRGERLHLYKVRCKCNKVLEVPQSWIREREIGDYRPMCSECSQKYRKPPTIEDLEEVQIEIQRPWL